MKVRLARTAGFCMGVKRAMELALSAAHQEDPPVYTFGPLIHNPQAVELLAGKGVNTLDEIPPPGSVDGGTVIIRAHGVPRPTKDKLKAAGFAKVINGTCPRVVKVQAIIRRAARSGADPVIVGDPDHPEVVGLLSYSMGRGHVVSSPEEVKDLPELERVVAVAQTTQSEKLFQGVVTALRERFGGLEVHHTICEATRNRQDEVVRLASEVDGVVVVGGRQSGNTKRLAELAQAAGGKTFLVESEGDLDRAGVADLETVGLTAGASTPNWMIKRVMREVAAIRSAKETRPRYWASQIFRFMVRSQILVASGAAGMTLAADLLQGFTPSPAAMGVAFCYIFAMHVLNHFLDKEAGQYNDPDRAAFLAKHGHFLIAGGVVCALASLLMCVSLGPMPLLVVSLMSVLGILYSVPVIPRGLRQRLGIESLKDIPGSKTLSAALAWGVVAAVVPALARGGLSPGGVALAFCYVSVLVFIRCAVFDILDVQGDLIVGKETIPIVIGEKNTRTFLVSLSAGLAGLLAVSPLWGVPAGLALTLISPIAGMAVMQWVFSKNLIMPGTMGEGLVDLNFWLAGAAALAYLAF